MKNTLPAREEKALRFAEANLRIEGLVVSPKLKKDCRRMLKGQVTADKLVASYLAPFKKE